MAEIDREKLLDIYTRTMKVNRTDEKFRELLMQGKVAVMYYLSLIHISEPTRPY